MVGAAAADALELPVAVVPSTYLLGKALVEAAGGDDSELNAQIEALKNNSLTGGILKGDVGQIKDQLLHHPLFSALEASGIESVVGRGAGATARALSEGKVGNRDRAPLSIGGDQDAIPRTPYSPDLFKQAAQKAPGP